MQIHQEHIKVKVFEWLIQQFKWIQSAIITMFYTLPTHPSLLYIIIYQVSKFIHSSILLVKRGSRESHEIQLLTT